MTKEDFKGLKWTFVGMIGQSSNLLINDLEEIKDFLEKQRSLLDFLDEPY